jgi:hypothetical protein
MIYEAIQERRSQLLVTVRVAVPHNGAGSVLMLDQRNASPTVEWSGAGVTVTIPRVQSRCWLPLAWDDSYVSVLDAAWRLGAWDVQRVDYGADDGSDPTMRMALANAFVHAPYAITLDGAEIDRDEQVEREQTAACAAASEHGWSSWSFRPIQGNAGQPWSRWLTEDATLDTDGGRSAVRSIRHRQHECAPQPGCARCVIYKLGRPHGDR